MFVVELAGVQAVVELAEEFVEQVPLGLMIPSLRQSGVRRSDDGPPGKRAAMPGPRWGLRR